MGSSGSWTILCCGPGSGPRRRGPHCSTTSRPSSARWNGSTRSCIAYRGRRSDVVRSPRTSHFSKRGFPMAVKSAAADTAGAVATNSRPGAILALILLCVYGGLAVSIDFPRTANGIHSDEATYYMMGHSLAEDGDLTYRKEDLVRVWREFPSGPSGLFLKKGTDIVDAGLMRRPPFVWTSTQNDPDTTRLFYGKSFAYPLFAAPFVKIFGTNGFLVLHALLMALSVWCAFLFLHARMP